jgi:hypothetical protein
MKTYYIAGPMTGRPQFNIPAFRTAAAHLRAQGLEVISPHEQDSVEIQEAAFASMTGDLADLAHCADTWGTMLARCVHTIADKVDGIVFLPTWERSRGARLEAFAGLLCGREFAYFDPSSPEGLYRITAKQVHDILKRNLP